MYKDSDYCAEVANALLPGAIAQASDIVQLPLQPVIMHGRRKRRLCAEIALVFAIEGSPGKADPLNSDRLFLIWLESADPLACKAAVIFRIFGSLI
jgi:hypothetical protein